MILNLSSILELTSMEAADIIRNAPRKRLGDVTLFDLILDGDQELSFVHGVYMFFNSGGQDLLYVGRVQSPQFIERLPGHLAIGEGSWSNQFLKGHRQYTNGSGTLAEAAASARECELLLLPTSPKDASKVEALFIRLLNPLYNKLSPNGGLPKDLLPTTTVGELLQTE